MAENDAPPLLPASPAQRMIMLPENDPMPAAPPPAAEEAAAWEAPRPRTLVDHAVDVILAAASRGLLLPGDRLVEKDLSKLLNMSRVPIREAIRLLESQGIVTSEPYKGIRLMSVTRERLEQVLDVRVALETLACRRAIEHKRIGPREMARLGQAVDELRLMGERGDVYGFAKADTDFHRRLCALAANPVLSAQWESLARQLTIIFGLSTLGKAMPQIVYEHRLLVEVLAGGDAAAMERALAEHILVQPHEADFERVIAERRKARDG